MKKSSEAEKSWFQMQNIHSDEISAWNVTNAVIYDIRIQNEFQWETQTKEEHLSVSKLYSGIWMPEKEIYFFVGVRKSINFGLSSHFTHLFQWKNNIVREIFISNFAIKRQWTKEMGLSMNKWLIKSNNILIINRFANRFSIIIIFL